MLSATSVETQSFDTAASAAAAGWTEVGCTRDVTNCGTDFGFSATTNNAGGSTGEAGGQFSRLGSRAFYMDTDLGGTLDLEDALHATGRVFGQNLNFDGGIHIGWFDADIDDLTSTPAIDRLGIFFLEGCSGSCFRSGPSLFTSFTNDIEFGPTMPENRAFEFAIDYDPNGGTGFGAITYTLTDPLGPSTTSRTLNLSSQRRNAGAHFNSFGILLGEAFTSEDISRQAKLFVDDLTYTVAAEPITLVSIDVKPDSNTNTTNLAANGVLPVVVFTTDDFDASTVDIGTVTFAGAYVVQSALEDVDGDGDLDLVLHFKIQEMLDLQADYRDALAADLADNDILDDNHQNVAVTLRGRTTDGTLIEGTDMIDAFFAGKALKETLDSL